MTDKSADAFRTISEAAEELDLPAHVLRFWETRFPQIKPMKRGGGRRYYRPDDVELLKGIRYLLYVRGFTIRGVQRILKESGHRPVMAIGAGDLRVSTGCWPGAPRRPRPRSSPISRTRMPRNTRPKLPCPSSAGAACRISFVAIAMRPRADGRGIVARGRGQAEWRDPRTSRTQAPVGSGSMRRLRPCVPRPH